MRFRRLHSSSLRDAVLDCNLGSVMLHSSDDTTHVSVLNSANTEIAALTKMLDAWAAIAPALAAHRSLQHSPSKSITNAVLTILADLLELDLLSPGVIAEIQVSIDLDFALIVEGFSWLIFQF